MVGDQGDNGSVVVCVHFSHVDIGDTIVGIFFDGWIKDIVRQSCWDMRWYMSGSTRSTVSTMA